jgi:outer membrane lipoprotein SlyB
MTSELTRKLQAAALTVALALPASTVMAQSEWSKPESRTKGTVIGAVAGALVGGTKGAVVGAALGNGVQYARHTSSRRHRYVRHVAYRHHHRR